MRETGGAGTSADLVGDGLEGDQAFHGLPLLRSNDFDFAPAGDATRRR
jgi:hypothetical protein